MLLELLTFSALTPEQMLERAEYEGDERVRLAYAKGKGVLFFTGHFGFWELQAHGARACKLRPIGVLARPLDNAPLNDLLERMRTRDRQHGDLPPGRGAPRAEDCWRPARAWRC